MEPDRRPTDQTAALHAALAATPPLRWPSPQRDQLWLAVQDAACTRGRAWAAAMGSSTPQEVGGPDARHIELLAAMTWLLKHERAARLMDPDGLFRILRGVAVRGKHGSARAAQADALHGMTGVSAGRPVTFAAQAVA
jgi:hypothetical protein